MTTTQLQTTTTGDRLELLDVEGYDFYREIHKGIRHALFTTTLRAGSLDVSDVDEVEGLLDVHRDLLHLLHVHHEHEDVFVGPLLVAHASGLAEEVAAQHGDIEAGIANQEVLARRLATVAAPGRSAATLRLYLDLSRLTGEYLAHQLLEETVVMPALRAAVPTEELLALDMQIRSTMPPEEMVRAMEHVLPAMNVEERVDMLGGMAMAPPEVFAIFRDAAQAILPADQFAQVARRIGIA
jgi:hypothetical protein